MGGRKEKGRKQLSRRRALSRKRGKLMKEAKEEAFFNSRGRKESSF